MSYNKLLERQLKRSIKNLDEQPSEIKKLLEAISQSYDHYESNRILLERSLEISSEELNKAYEKLTATSRVIEEKNKDITDSINYAKRIQEAILPSEQLIYRHLHDCFILYKPKDIVSGDFFWFAREENKTLIAAVDCTGHGVPGAFMSMIGNSTLNQLVKEKGLTEPGKILTQMSEAIRLSLRQDDDDSQTRDGMDAALCCVDFTTNEIHFAGAYRPLWCIKKSNGSYNLEEVKGDKFPIGGLHIIKQRIFTNHAFQINKGDTYYIFSDGYPDQFGGPEKRKFMTKRFKELLLNIQDKTMQEQKHILDKTVEDWRDNLEQMDDILVIGMRF